MFDPRTLAALFPTLSIELRDVVIIEVNPLSAVEEEPAYLELKAQGDELSWIRTDRLRQVARDGWLPVVVRETAKPSIVFMDRLQELLLVHRSQQRPNIQHRAMALLRAIKEHTEGTSEPVFVEQLGSALNMTKEEVQAAFRYLADKRYIDTLSIPYTARINAAGHDAILVADDGEGSASNGQSPATSAAESTVTPTQEDADAEKAVRAAFKQLIDAGERPYARSVPGGAERILVRAGEGRVTVADAARRTQLAIRAMAARGELEAPAESHLDWKLTSSRSDATAAPSPPTVRATSNPSAVNALEANATATASTTISNVTSSATSGGFDNSPSTQSASTATLVGRYTADDPYAIADDLLDVEHEARAFARIVAARAIRPPLAIAIFGEWGAGKTYFMRRIHEHVEQLRPSEQGSGGSLFYRDIVQIRFNAWHYIETNLWASLVEYIFSALDSWMQQQSGGDQSRTDLVFNRLATAQQLQLDALESLITRRAEQGNAEIRAQRAREEYTDALVQSQQIRPNAYFRALLETFLAEDPTAKRELKNIGTELGIPELDMAAEHATSVLAAVRSDTERGRLIWNSVIAKIGTRRTLLGIFAILFGLPAVVAILYQIASSSEGLAWIRWIHDSNVTWAAVVVALFGVVESLRRTASKALGHLDQFDKRLQASIDRQLKAPERSEAVKQVLERAKELQKRKQAVESAERALSEANARLSAARREFESGTARGRLNAFIRAKVTDGTYAKHLGIIASIRKDFVQLASLMGDVNNGDEERRERERLRKEAEQRVQGFLKWLEGTEGVRLTESEIVSLFSLLDPDDVGKTIDGWHTLLLKRFEGETEQLDQIQRALRKTSSVQLPRFSRIVLYIDDLDRCPPDKVVDVLQAVHLLLCFPLFVVVVAVDARWVSRALHERFPGLLSELGNMGSVRQREESQNESPPSGATSNDYLEKIFQIPYWVRAMEGTAATRYVQQIARSDRVQPSSEVDHAAATSAATSASAPASGATSASEALGNQSAPVVATSMTLSDWEIDALDRFAPYIGLTPRHAIRFVNIYRVIKTSLTSELELKLDLERGESPAGRALIPQLAIVNGAPQAAAEYFRSLMAADGGLSAAQYLEKWRADESRKSGDDGGVILRVLETLVAYESNRSGTLPQMSVHDLRFMASTVQRYSFTAR